MDNDSALYIVELADVREYLNIGDAQDDEELGHVVNAISALLNTMTGRTLLDTDLTEYYDGEGTAKLFTRSWPINSTTSTIEVYEDADHEFGDDSKLSSTQMFIDSEVGCIYRVNDVWEAGQGNIKVVYNAGYQTVPYDLRGAALEMMQIAWRHKKDGTAAFASLSRGDASMSFLNELSVLSRTIIKGYTRSG